MLHWNSLKQTQKEVLKNKLRARETLELIKRCSTNMVPRTHNYNLQRSLCWPQHWSSYSKKAQHFRPLLLILFLFKQHFTKTVEFMGIRTRINGVKRQAGWPPRRTLPRSNLSNGCSLKILVKVLLDQILIGSIFSFLKSCFGF